MSEMKRLSDRNRAIQEMLTSGEGLKTFYRFVANNPHIALHDACQIVIERPSASICFSFEEWNAQGRRVTKGRKGIPYDVAWQVLNSSDYLIPQNRKRVFLVGFLRDRCPGQVLAFRDANPRNLQHGGDEKGIADLTQPEIVLPIKSATKAGFRLARHGDGINIAYLRNNNRRGRVGDQISQTLTTNPTQGVFLAEPVQAVLNPDRI